MTHVKLDDRIAAAAEALEALLDGADDDERAALERALAELRRGRAT